jgi:predicted DNA-binding antitoxin AbrB/MazE fold protein
MVKQVKVRYRRGVLELLEPLEIEEGAELTVMLSTPEATQTAANPTAATAGAWASLLDYEVFEQELYANRLLQTRTEVEL